MLLAQLIDEVGGKGWSPMAEILKGMSSTPKDPKRQPGQVSPSRPRCGSWWRPLAPVVMI